MELEPKKETVTKEELADLRKAKAELEQRKKDEALLPQEGTPQPSQQIAVADPSPPIEKHNCGKCQSEVKKGQKFCGGCGGELEW